MQQVSVNPEEISKNINFPEKEEQQSHKIPIDQHGGRDIEEQKIEDVPSEVQVQKKKRSRSKKPKQPEDPLTVFIKELEERWKMVFIFDHKELLKMKGRGKRVKGQDLKEFLKDLDKTMEKHHIQKLDRFHLDLSKCYNFDDEGVDALTLHLQSTLADTKFLDLNFVSCPIHHQNVQDLVSMIGELQSLEYLSLDLRYCYRIEKELYQVLSSQVIEKLPHLKSLTLNLFSIGAGKNNKDFMTSIHSIGKNLKELEYLDLGRIPSTLQDETLAEMGAQLGTQLPSLKELILNFDCCADLTDQGISDLSVNIGHGLSQLKRLELNFIRCKFTDQALEHIAANIIPRLTGLEALKLKFDGCPKITNKGVQRITKAIGTNLSHLTELDLNFNGAFTVSDSDFQDISTSLGCLKNLTVLGLGFAGCKIGDETIQKFISNLKTDLTKIEELSLDFSGCKHLTEKGIKQFVDQLVTNFISLKSLELKLQNLKQITQQTQTFLLRLAKPLSSLKLLF